MIKQVESLNPENQLSPLDQTELLFHVHVQVIRNICPQIIEL